MLRERILSGIVLGIPVVGMLVAGGWWMALLVLIVGSLALLEYVNLVARRGHRAFGGLLLLSMGLFVADRVFPERQLLAPGVAALILLALAWSIVRFRQGTANAVTGFATTLAGSLYIGWTAAHFVSLRALEDGLFWTLTVVLAVWVADTGAYAVGRAVGHTPLIRDISPGKTWEGYLGGIIIGTGVSAALPLAWQALGASPVVSPLHGLIIGALISVITPLGDLGVSMIKRYAGTKHSSNLIPGHGGFLDRIDTLLVACLLGYYYLTLVVL